MYSYKRWLASKPVRLALAIIGAHGIIDYANPFVIPAYCASLPLFFWPKTSRWVVFFVCSFVHIKKDLNSAFLTVVAHLAWLKAPVLCPIYFLFVHIPAQDAFTDPILYALASTLIYWALEQKKIIDLLPSGLWTLPIISHCILGFQTNNPTTENIVQNYTCRTGDDFYGICSNRNPP